MTINQAASNCLNRLARQHHALTALLSVALPRGVALKVVAASPLESSTAASIRSGQHMISGLQGNLSQPRRER
jgi:hypothetical protein